MSFRYFFLIYFTLIVVISCKTSQKENSNQNISDNQDHAKEKNKANITLLASRPDIEPQEFKLHFDPDIRMNTTFPQSDFTIDDYNKLVDSQVSIVTFNDQGKLTYSNNNVLDGCYEATLVSQQVDFSNNIHMLLSKKNITLENFPELSTPPHI
ncbi:MAG: hypothetical protein AB8G05_19240 [Oligoflexales bacterium]